MSKSSINDNNKRFAPNRKLYFILICLSIIITVMFALVPQESCLFTIGIGIGCGGIASTVVAWLIDEANSKRELDRVRSNREALLNKIFLSFSNGLQNIIVIIEEDHEEKTTKKWFEWVDEAYFMARRNPTVYKTINTLMEELYTNLGEQMKTLEAQFIIILEHGLFSEDDIRAIDTIISICSCPVKDIFPLLNEQQLSEKILLYSEVIKTLITSSSNLVGLNEKEVEPTIYNILKKSETKS